MKRLFLIIIIITLFPFSSGFAFMQIGMGVTGGSINYYYDMFTSNFINDNPGDALSYGGHVSLLPFSFLEVEVSLLYSEKDGATVYKKNKISEVLDYNFKSINSRLSLKYKFFNPPLSPLSMYIGLGAGFHFLTTNFISVPSNIEKEDLEDIYNKFCPGIHGLIGIELSTPALPIAFFVEGMHEGFFLDNTNLQGSSIYGGLSYSF